MRRLAIALFLAPLLGWVACGGRAELAGRASQGTQSDAGGSAGLSSGADAGGSADGPVSTTVTGAGGFATATTTARSTMTTTGSSTGGTSGGTGEPPELPCDLEACRGLPVSEPDDRTVCVGTAYEREPIPRHLLMVVDSSAQMGEARGEETRWEVTSQALREFVSHEDLLAERVGLHLYASPNPDRCDPTGIVTPSVGMTGRTEAIEAFASELAGTDPAGTAMPYAAFSGALAFAEAWSQANLVTFTSVILLGGPNLASCESPVDFADIESLADRTAEQERLFAGALFLDADTESERNDCNEPVGSLRVVDSRLGADTLLEQLLALDQHITPQQTFVCEFEIPEPTPDGDVLDYDAVWLRYGLSSESFELPLLGSVTDCDSSPHGGFYYDGFDDAGDPSRVVLCPCSCSEFTDPHLRSVEITFGCLEDARSR